MPTFPSETDTFKFDLQGMLVVRRFIEAVDVDEINGILDPICARFSGSNKFDFITEHPRFLSLFSDRRVLQACASWIGPHFRFAEAWGIHGRPQNQNLHGGPFTAQGFNQYLSTSHRIACSCLVFAVVLTEQRIGDGGLVFLPGSHKAVKNESGDQVYRRLFNGRMDDESLAKPALMPGDAVFFAEALMHGTESWKPSDRSRRNLYFKYTDGFSTYLPDDDPQLRKLRATAHTDQQKRLLESPYVRNLGGSNAKNSALRGTTLL